MGYKYLESVPKSLNEAVKEICEKWDIKGVSDPGYIANVVAFEGGIGDGEGNFNGIELDLTKVDRIAERLAASYQTAGVTEQGVKDILIKYF